MIALVQQAMTWCPLPDGRTIRMTPNTFALGDSGTRATMYADAATLWNRSARPRKPHHDRHVGTKRGRTCAKCGRVDTVTTLRATNDGAYRAMVKYLKAAEVTCWRGCGNRATSPDHHPPVSQHTHLRGTGCCQLRPSCLPCQKRQGAQITNAKRASGYTW